MKTAIGKFDVFSKAFAQLSGESQDKLVKVAHHLLKTHKLVKRETAKQKSCKGQIIL
jgi:nicotinamide mononucleotide (NMN) deamidase PncC